MYKLEVISNISETVVALFADGFSTDGKSVCGKCAGMLVVVKGWPHTCAGNVQGDALCSKRWQKTCAGNARGILQCLKVAKHVCGKCAGKFAKL